MKNPNPDLKEKQQRRWLALWRRWGKPRLSLRLGYQPAQFGDFDGYLGVSGVSFRAAGDAFEHAGQVLQPFHIFAEEKDITLLVAELAELPATDGRIVVLCRNPSWHAMGVVASAVLVAHLNAAAAQRDIEALRALDVVIASQHVAIIEAELLAEATRRQGESGVGASASFSARSKRPRL